MVWIMFIYIKQVHDILLFYGFEYFVNYIKRYFGPYFSLRSIIHMSLWSGAFAV